MNLADWKIDLTRDNRGNHRWTWAIDYPISKYAVIGTRDFKSKSAAARDAYRVIRVILTQRGSTVDRSAE
jgi:hypothetical protein